MVVSLSFEVQVLAVSILTIRTPPSCDVRSSRTKPFLQSLYSEYCSVICSRLPVQQDSILELGSEAGFLKEYLPQVITSEVFLLDGVEREDYTIPLSFTYSAHDAIIMTDVLHHIFDLRLFFVEANRTLNQAGD